MSSLASCGSGFDWMKNEDGQDPCTVAAWLIELCQDASSNLPAGLAPLQSPSTSYLPPNGTSANACTCSWAFYNAIEACTVCQDFSAQDYSSWSSSCDILGQSSTSTYWQSTVSFSSRTKPPRWSILNPSNWASGTFNIDQAEQIAGQSKLSFELELIIQRAPLMCSLYRYYYRVLDSTRIGSEDLPDVTDASASQPSVSSSSSSATASASSAGKGKAPAGAIAGGVVAGVLVLVALAVALWFFVCRRKGRSRARGPRKHVDLDADGGGIGGGVEQGGDPLAAHLRSHSLSGYSTSPTSYHPPMQQTVFQGYPVLGAQIQTQNQSQSQGQPVNVALGITRTTRPSRDSIPTVAEQLDEKRRIRAERQDTGAPRPGPNAYASTGTVTGSNSRMSGTSASLDDANAGSNTAAISHARSQSQSQISTLAGSGTPPVGIGNPVADPRPAADKRASRRLSLKKAPWNRRRTVVNVGSDAGSDAGLTPGINTAPLPLNGTVAAAGHMTTASEVIAAVPGARLPSARERENPPPGYTSPNS